VMTMMTMTTSENKEQNRISHRGWVGERDGRERRRGHFRRDGDETHSKATLSREKRGNEAAFVL
jgi:hypothetical protein